MGNPYFEKRRFLNPDKAKELYDAGYCDQQIADTCDVSRESVRVWRRKNNLKGHKAPHKEPAKHRASTLAEMAAEAQAHGMSYGQYMVERREGKL